MLIRLWVLALVIHLTRALPRPQRSGSTAESTIILTDANLRLQVVTSTDLPAVQQPTTTSATQSSPDTSGTIPISLETGGNPRIQPFPTSLPSIVSSTFSPLSSTPISSAAREQPTTTQILSIPTSTVETVITGSTAITLPVQSVSTFLSVATRVVTIVHGCTASTTSIIEATETFTQTSNSLVATTVIAPTTSTTTLATTITTNGNPSTLSTAQPTARPTCTGMACPVPDIFLPVGLGAPPTNIPRRSDHGAPRLNIVNMTEPIETNKFYANFFLGSQAQAAFVQPYSLSWSRGGGNAQSWGMSISHIDPNQRVFGPRRNDIPGAPASYFINPIGIQSVIMSATEMGPASVLRSDSLKAFSAHIHLYSTATSDSYITFPLVQGMGFVTGIYRNLQPAIQSSVFFRSMVAAGQPAPGIFKYILNLEDGKVWVLYAMPNSGIDPNFQMVSSTLIQGLPSFSGTIQIAKSLPGFDFLYDQNVGVYPVNAQLTGNAYNTTASYTLTWGKAGPRASNTSLLIFALPHHVASFDARTSAGMTSLILSTTVKGQATAVLADTWTMVEKDMPIDMDLAPWRPGVAPFAGLSKTAVNAIEKVSAIEISQNMSAQTNLDSMYFSGKGLSKFATVAYVMHALSGQPDLGRAGIEELKKAFTVFTNNRQKYPLVYDTAWGGVVSSATYVTGDAGMDFGNSFYNDHHFHYGYFIHAAAIIGRLDPAWLVDNRDFVNTLVRDAANPSSQDQFFPVFRSFDWYAGHSWAKGLFESADGKDQESTSEDAMFAYALAMWGRTIGDASMEARGWLMLTVLKRSLKAYFLMDNDNVNQPVEFRANKVTGILFDNKIDHTTYFGANLEYVQGIHMLPALPFCAFTRSSQFVNEEWDAYFADGRVAQASNVVGGWRGVLYGNLALINPAASFNFFNRQDFDPAWLDGGASRTWYLAFAAGLGGV